jgi:hypothetical protein
MRTMLGDLSVSTIGLSASLSVVTGYFGTLMNFSRLRNRHRRVFGLSLLAEIKSLQRLFRRYYNGLGGDSVSGAPCDWPRLHFGTAETSVFNNGSGNLGLFSTRTAVEVIEFYSGARAIAAEAERLLGLRSDPQVNHARLLDDLGRHLVSIRLARHRSRTLVRVLRMEIPSTTGEKLRHGIRVTRIWLRRLRRRTTSRESGGQHVLSSVR